MECSWLNIISCFLSGLSTTGMLFMTFYVHKLTSKSRKRDYYFSRMVDLYYKIEDDLHKLNNEENRKKEESTPNFQYQQSVSRIKVNCSIMIYYLLRIPGNYKGRYEFVNILCILSDNPCESNNYHRFSEKYKEFCWELRDNIKGKNVFSFNYDGEPITQ